MAPKKKTISKALRIQVWNKEFTENVGKSFCKCCEITEITQLKFHCGHIIAEAMGGTTTLNNLTPICESCNKSMSTKNLHDFKATLKDTDVDMIDVNEKNNINIIKQNYYKLLDLYEIIKKYRIKFNINKISDSIDSLCQLNEYDFMGILPVVNNDLSNYSVIYTKIHYGNIMNRRNQFATLSEYLNYIVNITENDFINEIIDYYKKTNDNALLEINELNIHPYIELIKKNIDIFKYKQEILFKNMLDINM